jgi:hypothetical protein
MSKLGRGLLGLACWQPNVVYFMVGAGFDEILTRWLLGYDWAKFTLYVMLAVGIGMALKTEVRPWP